MALVNAPPGILMHPSITLVFALSCKPVHLLEEEKTRSYAIVRESSMPNSDIVVI